MKKIEEKPLRCLLFALGFNSVLFGLFSVIGKTVYEMADDFELSQFIANEHYEFIYIDYYFERFLGTIQRLIYPLNAYVIVSIILSVVAVSVIMLVFIERAGIRKAVLITLFVDSVFASSFFLVVSFSRYAAILTVSGILAVVHYSPKKWLSGTFIGGLLCLIGSFYRFKIFESVFVMGAAFVLALSFNQYKLSKEPTKKFVGFLKIIFEPKRLIVAVLIVSSAFAINIASKHSFSSTDELKQYREYTSARSKIYDYQIPSYEKAKKEYVAIGIDSTELKLMEYSVLDKDGGFSLEQLNKIDSIRKNTPAQNNSIIKAIINAAKIEIGETIGLSAEGITLIGLVLVLTGYFVLQKKANIIPVLFILVSLVALFIYLFYYGRAPYRVKFGILLMSILAILYLVDYEKVSQRLQTKRIYKSIFMAVLIVTCISFSVLNVMKNKGTSHPADASAVQAILEMEQDTSAKYEFFGIETMSMSTEADVKDVFHIQKADLKSNLFNQQAVYYLTPFYYELLENFGTDNVYRNLLGENVFAVFRNTEERKDIETYMQRYLQKYYAEGKTVTMKKVKTYDAFSVYKYTLV